MIIRHMQGTFGTLDGEQLRLDTGLNIIYAPNESGKSTWCAFLRAMLYGIDTSQRARAGFVPDKQKYAPWSGKPMAGELELEQGGKCITIRRWTETPGAPLRGFSAVSLPSPIFHFYFPINPAISSRRTRAAASAAMRSSSF